MDSAMSMIDISYLGLGPQAGYRVVVDGVGLRILSYSAFHGRPTDIMLDGFSKNFNPFLESLNSIPHRGESGLYEKVPFRERESIISHSELHYNIDIHVPSGTLGKKTVPVFVKYISEETFERFTRHGSFKIGSVTDYRFIPDSHARDPLEGYCSLYFKNRGNHILISVFGGENLHVFCGTNAIGSEYMKQKFGPIQLILNDVTGFGNAVAEDLGAIDWEIKAVNYRVEKVKRAPSFHAVRIDPKNMERWIRCTKTMHCLYRYLSETGPPGTVFLKPVRYAPERELRFVIRMREDIPAPYWRVINRPDLLNYFRVIKS
jgi:hypothetical protein